MSFDEESYEAYEKVIKASVDRERMRDQIEEYKNERFEKLKEMTRTWKNDSIEKSEKYEIFKNGFEYCDEMIRLHNALIDDYNKLNDDVLEAEQIAYNLMKKNRKIIKLNVFNWLEMCYFSIKLINFGIL